jgi:hypothetical protein
MSTAETVPLNKIKTTNITNLDNMHCPVFHLKRFGDWILSPSSGGAYSDEPNRQR